MGKCRMVAGDELPFDIQHIVTGEGKGLAPLGYLDLEVDHFLPPERSFGPSQIELPHAGEAFVIDFDDLVAPRHETLPPGLQRLRVMEPQDLYGGNDKARLFDRRKNLRQRSEEHTSELQSRENLVCRLLLEKKKT